MVKFFFLPVLVLTTLLLVVTSSFAQSATLTATVKPNPLEVKVVAPNNVQVDKWFDIETQIINKGDAAIEKTFVTIHTPSELSVRGKKVRIGTLTAGGTTKVVWRAKAKEFGNFVVQVDVGGNLNGEKVSASDTTLISASDSILTLWLRRLFGR